MSDLLWYLAGLVTTPVVVVVWVAWAVWATDS